jgi:hypothetical protein
VFVVNGVEAIEIDVSVIANDVSGCVDVTDADSVSADGDSVICVDFVISVGFDVVIDGADDVGFFGDVTGADAVDTAVGVIFVVDFVEGIEVTLSVVFDFASVADVENNVSVGVDDCRIAIVDVWSFLVHAPKSGPAAC